MRDVEASGCPPSSQRASAKLYTPEEKSEQGRQHGQEINDIPKPKVAAFYSNRELYGWSAPSLNHMNEQFGSVFISQFSCELCDVLE